MKKLKSILLDVSKGNLETEVAEEMIQALFKPDKRNRSAKQSDKDSSVFAEVLAGLRAQGSVRDLYDKSKRLARVDWLRTPPGIEARFSLLAEVEVSPDSRIAGNSVSGSQWNDVTFNEECDAKENKFTVTQISGFQCSRSDFGLNHLGLARLTDVTLCESRFENNRISRTQCADLSITESDFTRNRLLSCQISGVAVNGSRLSGLALVGCRLSECEFDQSDIQGLRFEGCQFDECSFVNCEIVTDDYPVIENYSVRGLRIQGVRSAKELVALLESATGASHNAGRPTGGHGRRARKKAP